MRAPDRGRRRLAAPRFWAPWSDVLPPTAAWIALDAVGVALVAVLALAVMARVDRWRGRSRLGLSPTDPRRGMKSRSWAKPRDWQHLQVRATSNRTAARLLTGERRAPAPRGGDGWALGELRGVAMRSLPEMHLCVIAPTRSGKTTRVVMREAAEHAGPAVVLSNKTDVLAATAAIRAERGPVWVHAPMSDLRSVGMRGCGWTPLTGCGDWSGALAMAQWIFDADPGAAAASDQAAELLLVAPFEHRPSHPLLPPRCGDQALIALGRYAPIRSSLRRLGSPLADRERPRCRRTASSRPMG